MRISRRCIILRNRKKTTIIKQIQGDLQTLEGLAVILGEIGGMERGTAAPILQEINNDNAFIRMGFARPDGGAWLVDLDGSIYEISFRDMEFFQMPFMEPARYRIYTRMNAGKTVM